MRTIVLAVVLTLATATGCSSGAGVAKTPSPTLSADQKSAIQSLSTAMTKGRQGFTVDAGQAACLAQQLVTQLGTDTLSSYGLLNAKMRAKGEYGGEAMTQTDAETTAEIFFGCVDKKTMLRVIEQGQTSLPRKTVRCLRNKLDDQALKKLFVIVLTQNQNVNSWGTEITKPMISCISGT